MALTQPRLVLAPAATQCSSGAAKALTQPRIALAPAATLTLDQRRHPWR